MKLRNAFALRSVSSVSETTRGRAARPATTTPSTVASSRPVPIRSVSTSSCARGGAPGSAAGRRFQVLWASHGATAAIRARLPEVAISRAGTGSTPPPTGGSRHMINPSSSVIAMKVGHIHAPRSRQRIRAGQKRSSRSTAPESSLRFVAELWVAQLGTVPYRDGVELQKMLRERRQAGELPDLLLVLEHPPVYTKGRRTASGDLPMPMDWYRDRGIEVCDTDRGGRVTYHGPGQLVAYPIMAVERVADFVHTMERAIVAALADEGVVAEPRATPFTGVWAGEAKIASIGVRVREGVSMHGLAVNVDNGLEPFEWIVPCGIDRVRVSSVARETGRSPSLPCFRKRLAYRFAGAFGRRQRIVTPRRILERERVAA